MRLSIRRRIAPGITIGTSVRLNGQRPAADKPGSNLTPEQATKRRKTNKIILSVTGGIIFLVAVGGMTSGGKKPTASAPAARSTAATATVEPAAAKPAVKPAAKLVTTSAPKPAPKAAPKPVVAYANCTEVREAGADPILKGQPGWNDALDRDHDGVACETK